MEPLLPAGEPVEGLLRRLQFFTPGTATPDYREVQRGCPRGASFSWYTYSPGRVRYPYVRGELLRRWREIGVPH